MAFFRLDYDKNFFERSNSLVEHSGGRGIECRRLLSYLGVAGHRDQLGLRRDDWDCATATL